MFCKVNYYPGKGVDNEREGRPPPRKKKFQQAHEWV